MKPSLIALVLFALSSTPVPAGVIAYLNDYTGFQAAAGALEVIDFETLPDGNTSHAGIPITNAYNYDAFGAHFSAPLGTILTQGSPGMNPLQGIGIRVEVSFPNLTWITCELTEPASAIGVFFPGNTTVRCYDTNGTLLASPWLNGSGNQFIGVVSDVPIAHVVVDRQARHSAMSAFLFTPVPEPATFGLILIGITLLQAKRRALQNRNTHCK